MNIALVLSGGTGTRLASDVPKQYICVQGQMIITYTLQALCACEQLDGIQVVAAQAWQGKILSEFPVRSKFKGFSMPGETRQLSILNGLRDIQTYAADEDIVLIHDAVRPMATADLIRHTLDAAVGCDGAVPVLAMKDTVYYSEDGTSLTRNLERAKVVVGQAPEAFRLGKYLDANEALSLQEMMKLSGSAEPAVLAGLDIALVPGEERNFKITTNEDLEYFKRLMEGKGKGI